MIEDPLYLHKDETLVFMICDPHDYVMMNRKIRLEQTIKSYGYIPKTQYWMTSDFINNDIDFKLNFRNNTMGDNGILEWYAFVAILKKIARQKSISYAVITWPAFSYWPDDITRAKAKLQMHLRGGRLLISTKAANMLLNSITPKWSLNDPSIVPDHSNILFPTTFAIGSMKEVSMINNTPTTLMKNVHSYIPPS